MKRIAHWFARREDYRWDHDTTPMQTHLHRLALAVVLLGIVAWLGH